MYRSIIARLLLCSAPMAAWSQLDLAAANPVVYGHHHLNVTDVDAHKRLWAGVFGGTPTTFGANEVVKLPNVLIFLRAQSPSGDTKGSTVNHIGFSVPDLGMMLRQVRMAGFPIVTRQELPAGVPIEDGIAHIAAANLNIAFVMGPDGIKIELVEDPGQQLPVDLHHVHFAAADPGAVRDWYVATFGGRAGRSGNFETVELAGVTLSFLPSADPLEGTQGRSLDHVGFEIDGLEAFCRGLAENGVQFDRAYTEIPERGIALAYFTDPWGTYIELTEGLDKL